MMDRKITAGESGSFIALAISVTAICVVTAAAALLAPAAATSGVSAAAADAGPGGYFPNQFVNQAKEIEPMPEMCY